VTEPERSVRRRRRTGRNLRPVPLALLVWLWPSILAAFAVPGFLVLHLALQSDTGALALTARRIELLRGCAWCVLIGTIAVRAVLWPPPRLAALISRLGRC
jgi:hypothetical protein